MFPNEQWAMDFVSDSLFNGKFSDECLEPVWLKHKISLKVLI